MSNLPNKLMKNKTTEREGSFILTRKTFDLEHAKNSCLTTRDLKKKHWVFTLPTHLKIVVVNLKSCTFDTGYILFVLLRWARFLSVLNYPRFHAGRILSDNSQALKMDRPRDVPIMLIMWGGVFWFLKFTLYLADHFKGVLWHKMARCLTICFLLHIQCSVLITPFIAANIKMWILNKFSSFNGFDTLE